MSTRGCIARSTGEGTFVGVYHHWDSYPAELGSTLLRLYAGHFRKNLHRLTTFLIDEHPAGWSTINKLPNVQPVGYGKEGLNCYCHGERHEEAQRIDEKTDAGMEWAYVFDEDAESMYILERRHAGTNQPAIGMFGTLGTDNVYWQEKVTVDLKKPETYSAAILEAQRLGG